MKKSLIFKILYLLLGLVVIAGASVFATNTYLASQVSYGNSNVEDALNGLFELQKNMYNYTTDEQVIGTWIDGKKLYKKTIDIEINKANTSSEFVTNNTLTNVDNICNIYGILVRTSKSTLTVPYYENSSYFFDVKVDSTNVRILNNGFYGKSYLTIEYTKTTN